MRPRLRLCRPQLRLQQPAVYGQPVGRRLPFRPLIPVFCFPSWPCCPIRPSTTDRIWRLLLLTRWKQRITKPSSIWRNVWERPSREDWPGRRSISYRPIDFPEKLKRVVRALASFVCANLKRDRPFASFPAATSTTPSASTNGSSRTARAPYVVATRLNSFTTSTESDMRQMHAIVHRHICESHHLL